MPYNTMAKELFNVSASLLSRLGRWGLLQWLVAITVVYLFWQISLSGAILTADSPEKSTSLSELAKNTVGFGMFLFVFRLGSVVFSKNSGINIKDSTKTRWFWILLAISFLSGWVAMTAEDRLVSYFARKTSGQERLEAKKILFFNSAITQNKVRFPDLPKDIQESRVRTLAFVKALGFAIWNNKSLIEEINNLLNPVLNAMYGDKYYSEINREYDEYVKFFNDYWQKKNSFQTAITGVNFAQYAHYLAISLQRYGACVNDECRKKIKDDINLRIRKQFGDLAAEIEFEPEDFCKIEKQQDRYIGGRLAGESVFKICTVSEKELRDYFFNFIKTKPEGFSAKNDSLPEDIKNSFLDGKALNIKEWRSLFGKNVDREIEKIKATEFGNPKAYEKKGPKETEGEQYAISIFLPPVALGFSIGVCFLHAASLVILFFGHSPLVWLTTACICISPCFLAQSVPLKGSWGIYAKWLVFWEGELYPVGILRWVIG